MKKTTLANFFAPEETSTEFCIFNQLESTHTFTLKQTWFNRMRPNHLIVVFAEKHKIVQVVNAGNNGCLVSDPRIVIQLADPLAGEERLIQIPLKHIQLAKEAKGRVGFVTAFT